MTQDKKFEHYYVQMHGRGMRYLDEQLNRTNKRLNSKNVKLIQDSLSNTISVTSGKEVLEYVDTEGRTIERHLPSNTIGVKNYRDLAEKLIPENQYITKYHIKNSEDGKLISEGQDSEKEPPYIFQKKSKQSELLLCLAKFITGGQYSYSDPSMKLSSNLIKLFEKHIDENKKGFGNIEQVDLATLEEYLEMEEEVDLANRLPEIANVWRQEVSITCFQCQAEQEDYKPFVASVGDHLIGNAHCECRDMFITARDIDHPQVALEVMQGNLKQLRKLINETSDPVLNVEESLKYHNNLIARLRRNNKCKQKQNINLLSDIADVFNLPTEVFTDDMFEEDDTKHKPAYNANASIALISMDYLLDKITMADEISLDFLDSGSEKNFSERPSQLPRKFDANYFDFDYPPKPKSSNKEMPIEFLEQFELILVKIEAFASAMNARSLVEARDILDEWNIPSGLLKSPSKKILAKHATEYLKQEWLEFSSKNYSSNGEAVYPILQADFYNVMSLMDVMDEGIVHKGKACFLRKSRELDLTLYLGQVSQPLILATYDSNWRNVRAKHAYIKDPRKTIAEFIRVSLGISNEYSDDYPKVRIAYEHPYTFFNKRSWFSIFQDYPNELLRIIETEMAKQQK